MELLLRSRHHFRQHASSVASLLLGSIGEAIASGGQQPRAPEVLAFLCHGLSVRLLVPADSCPRTCHNRRQNARECAALPNPPPPPPLSCSAGDMQVEGFLGGCHSEEHRCSVRLRRVMELKLMADFD